MVVVVVVVVVDFDCVEAAVAGAVIQVARVDVEYV